MLTKSGAKLLDFGLAKLKERAELSSVAHLASAPTQTTPLTGEGMIVGTLQYMAPEQLEGKRADARTDLWALGAILYEMLTGRRAFEGASAAGLITAIMSGEPPLVASLQPLTPPGVDRLVRRCLAKTPDERWDSGHDVADELRWLAESARSVIAAERVLWVNGRDLRHRPLVEREARLRGILPAESAHLLHVDYVPEKGQELFALACAQDLEGVVGKRMAGTYQSNGRTTSWVKVKNATYSQAEGRAEFFEKTPRPRRARPPELKLV